MAAKYEYHLFTAHWGHDDKPEKLQGELNKRGSEGWDLVSVVRDESPSDDHDEETMLFVFKREKA